MKSTIVPSNQEVKNKTQDNPRMVGGYSTPEPNGKIKMPPEWTAKGVTHNQVVMGEGIEISASNYEIDKGQRISNGKVIDVLDNKKEESLLTKLKERAEKTGNKKLLDKVNSIVASKEVSQR